MTNPMKNIIRNIIMICVLDNVWPAKKTSFIKMFLAAFFITANIVVKNVILKVLDLVNVHQRLPNIDSRCLIQ